MINVYGNYYIPSDGYKYLSNTHVWTKSIYLGRTDSIENWHDTNEEPPEESEEPEEIDEKIEQI